MSGCRVRVKTAFIRGSYCRARVPRGVSPNSTPHGRTRQKTYVSGGSGGCDDASKYQYLPKLAMSDFLPDALPLYLMLRKHQSSHGRSARSHSILLSAANECFPRYPA